MKLYDFPGAPNPRRVKIFLAEKGIDVEIVHCDMTKGEHKTPAFLKKNPSGKIPVLELDDGTVITESQAICRYLEALHPEPSLFGRDPLQRAEIEMWDRRMELVIMNPLGQIARHSFAFFADKLTQVPAFAEAQRADVAGNLAWLDEELSDGRPFIAGDRFSVADITGMTALMIADFVQVAIPAALPHLSRWNEAIRARPSWAA